MESTDTVTAILKQARSGSREALDRLFPLLYTELRAIASRQLRSAPPDGTLRTTALINEAYLRMVDQDQVDLVDRSHFFAYASRVMRSALVDHARRMGAKKRGGDAVRLSLEDRDMPVEAQAEFVLALDEALTRLAEVADRACRVVECRYFGGLTESETADALGVTDRTVRRDWLKAKAYLYEALA